MFGSCIDRLGPSGFDSTENFSAHRRFVRAGGEKRSIEAYLPDVAVPVLLIQGDRDAYGSVAQLDAIERGVAGPVTRRWLESCGHAPHRERPGETLEAIEAFLATAVLTG